MADSESQANIASRRCANAVTALNAGGDTAVASYLDRLAYGVFRGAYKILGGLPYSSALRVGAAIGTLFYALDRPHHRIALFNLKIAFPEKSDAERRQILLASCRNLGRLAAEVCQLEHLTAQSARERVSIEEPAFWRSALDLAGRKGAVILTGHFGNWELLAYFHALIGHPITLVHRPMKNPLVDAAILAIRQRPGTRSIAKKAAAKEVIRALQRREMVAIPADQNQTRRFGVFVDFFGVPASTTPGPARLAMLTGAPVFPVFLVREGESERHRVVVLPEVEIVKTGDREADVLTNTQRCNEVIESMIRKHPDHWIWFHKRWRTRPLGEPPLY